MHKTQSFIIIKEPTQKWNLYKLKSLITHLILYNILHLFLSFFHFISTHSIDRLVGWLVVWLLNKTKDNIFSIKYQKMYCTIIWRNQTEMFGYFFGWPTKTVNKNDLTFLQLWGFIVSLFFGSFYFCCCCCRWWWNLMSMVNKCKFKINNFGLIFGSFVESLKVCFLFFFLFFCYWKK